MNAKGMMSALGLTRFWTRRECRKSEKPMEMLTSGLSAAARLLPDGNLLVEYDGGSEVVVRMTWRQKGNTDIEPFSMSFAADSRFVTLNKQDDGKPAYTLLNNNVAAASTAKEADGVHQQRLMQRVKAFVAEHFLLRFNMITAQTECAAKDETDAEGHHIYVGVDHRLLNTITSDAICAGINCWDRDVKRCIESTQVAEYHPFRQYMDSLPEWDGRNRATEVAHLVSNNTLLTNAFHRWLLGMTAQWMQHGDRRYANSVAPMLISTRQGWGKSTFCRSLMPQCLLRYYTDNYDITSEARAEQKLTAFGLINIDEFDKLSAKKQPILKNLMQMPTANIRRPYKHVFEQLPRIASFIATSNRRDLLADKSGSRRFVCIELERPIDTSYTIDHDQLFAQLKHELLSGERYWLSKQEEIDIQKHNRQYYIASPVADLFHEMFAEVRSSDTANSDVSAANPDVVDINSNISATTKSDVSVVDTDVSTADNSVSVAPSVVSATSIPLLSAADIYERMRKEHPQAMRGTNLLAFSKLLPTLATNVHTRYGNGYMVRLKSEE